MQNKRNQLKFIDLFAGIGGIRLAFEAAGCECAFTSEWDKYSQQTYKSNFATDPFGDITKIKEQDIPEFDILTAGFPCQPFSTIGKREGFAHKTQGTLFYDVARIIAHHKPRAILLENVPGLMTHDNGKTITTIFETLMNLGYDLWYKILDAADFGLPQKRKRIYIVGLKVTGRRQAILTEPMTEGLLPYENRFKFPDSENSVVGIGKFLEKNITGHSISKHLQKVYLFKIQDGRPELVDNKSKLPVKTLVASYHKIQRLTGTFVRDGETGVRLLTVNECKAIMGFPKKFIVPVSRTQMYRQFGNSVAVPVVTAIAKNIVRSIQNEAKSVGKNKIQR